MGLTRQAMKQVLTACVPRSRLLTRGPRCGSGLKSRLALTFDDGPHPIHTPALLDVLTECNVIGTFFVVGREAERHPDLIQRIANEGHEIGNHTWSHSEPERTSPREFLAEVRRTDELIENLTGRTPSVMRPPKGELNWRKMSGLWQLKKTVALWNVDPRDYRMRSVDEMSAWCAAYRPEDGDVLLFHDNHGWVQHAVRKLFDDNVFNRFQSVVLSTLARNNESLPTGLN